MNEDAIFLGESLVAVLGVDHVLAPKIKAPSDAEVSRALKLGDVLKKRVRALLDATKTTGQVGPPVVPDYTETLDTLTKGADLDRLADAIATLPPVLQSAATAVWTRAVSYLAGILPKSIEMQLTGPKAHEPGNGAYGEWGWAYRVACSPLIVIDLAADGMLLTREAHHLRALFPAIHSALCSDIQDALADKIAADPDWVGPWWLRKQLCTILGVSPASPTLVADIDQAVQRSQQEAKKTPSTGNLEMKNETSTATQRLAGK